MNNNNEPIAWAFYNPDGTIRFIIDDKKRMELWSKAHNGSIVPLVPLVDNTKKDEKYG